MAQKKEDYEERIKRAIIAGAGAAITYSRQHPRASESEVMQHVSQHIREIIENVE